MNAMISRGLKYQAAAGDAFRVPKAPGMGGYAGGGGWFADGHFDLALARCGGEAEAIEEARRGGHQTAVNLLATHLATAT